MDSVDDADSVSLVSVFFFFSKVALMTFDAFRFTPIGIFVGCRMLLVMGLPELCGTGGCVGNNVELCEGSRRCGEAGNCVVGINVELCEAGIVLWGLMYCSAGFVFTTTFWNVSFGRTPLWSVQHLYL
jgi:hypothetical protein